MSHLPTRTLGQNLKVSGLGLGCMGMSWAYGEPDDAESLRVLQRAFEMGMNFWDTAEIYGPFKNEELLGKAMEFLPRGDLVIATKFGWEFNEKGERTKLNGSAKHIKKTVEGSLKRLGTDYIDLYYQHRVDQSTPIEETVGAMAELVKEGKILHIGLSEASAETIRRAHKVHPITAVQSEYSLWERGVEQTVLPTLKELGIGFVPYSPMGRGMLTGMFQKFEDIPLNDSRRSHPRFSKENFDHNMELVKAATFLGKELNATPAQIAIAWLLKQDDSIVPIPGTKRLKNLEENADAIHLKITDAQWAPLEEKLRGFKTHGMRYTPDNMKLLDE